MFIACPHCRYLVATDPRGQHAPQRCPRCGGALAAIAEAGADETEGGRGQSLASLLRRDEAGTAGTDTITAQTDPPAPTETSAVADTRVHAIGGDAAEDAVVRTNEDVVDDVDARAATEADANADIDARLANDDSGSAEPPSPVDANAPVDADAMPPRIDPVATPMIARAGTRPPSFLRGQRASSPSPSSIPRWQWASAGVLAVVLVVQVLLADRERLAADAGWRPLIASLCGVFGCSMPPWREPAAFAMLDRDVRPVAGAPGVLQAQATFRNEARWSQPWPILMLTLKDADGRTLGARALAPADYLPGDAAAAEIAPGQSAQVAVRLREPSANVVAFSFDFH